MKKLLIVLSSLVLSSLSLAQINSTPTAGALILPSVNSTVNGSVANFPPAPASGYFDIVINDNDTMPGSPSSNTVTPGVNFTFNTGTGILDVVQPDWSVTNSTYPGYIANKPTLPTIERGTVTTDSSGNVTWTYPVAYPAGTVPACSCLPTGVTTVNLNVQKVSASNTSVTFKVWSLPQTSILGIVVLGGPVGGASIACDVIAVA